MRVSWSGLKADNLSWMIFLILVPAVLASVQSSMVSLEMITRISRVLLFGLSGSFPNFQSICKTTSSPASISIRAFLGNKGRINSIHSLTKGFIITISSFQKIAALTREHGGWEQARLRASDERSRVQCLVPAQGAGARHWTKSAPRFPATQSPGTCG